MFSKLFIAGLAAVMQVGLAVADNHGALLTLRQRFVSTHKLDQQIAPGFLDMTIHICFLTSQVQPQELDLQVVVRRSWLSSVLYMQLP